MNFPSLFPMNALKYPGNLFPVTPRALGRAGGMLSEGALCRQHGLGTAALRYLNLKDSRTGLSGEER